jgi:hypothetical protein
MRARERSLSDPVRIFDIEERPPILQVGCIRIAMCLH